MPSENLNEHVIGGVLQPARVRHERLSEAAQIIRALFGGEYVNFSGQHFEVERARLYDLPDTPVPIGIAVSGADSVSLAAEHADCMIATEPDGALIGAFNQAGGFRSAEVRSAAGLLRRGQGHGPRPGP